MRALADVLRTELMRYSGSSSQYSVHVAFPSNFISPSFVDEQKNKPALTRRLEGTSASTPELAKKLHSASQVAEYIVAAVDRGQYVICSEFEAALLFGGMVGLSPKRGLGISDSLTAMLAIVAAPLLRRWLDAKCAADRAG